MSNFRYRRTDMETLLQILQGLHPDVDFASIDDLYDEGVLDSLDMVRLVTEIGMEFDVQIPAEELVPENFPFHIDNE